MIITKKVKLFTSKIKKKQHYIDLGYDLSKDFIIVNIELKEMEDAMNEFRSAKKDIEEKKKAAKEKIKALQ